MTHCPSIVLTLRFTLDSSPLADVNNEPCITRGTRVNSSEDFSSSEIGIIESDIRLNFSIILFDFLSGSIEGEVLPITSDSEITKNSISV